ncbi:sigma-E processing peptidase SpoIIGA [Clostridium gelidum]|uniref:Sporulation sigma-E factor-processing peptidase n=1 Tax=Clostridium gelidum TaxID=704125 RepID=A0ABN6J1J8_9CLOT|nr:sigma-E processing peptidase SpoIIGA [Clostridium gelidum]BCZ48216.1 sigma-E processing peptidase SpoIIGA [Clostridium gelidum]
MEVYADVVILENCIVNFFLLTLTMKCIKHKCKMVALIYSSLIGGIYTIVLLIPKLKILSYLPCELAIACIMIRIVYGKTSVFNMIKVLGIFLMVTFTLSGICFLFSLKQNVYLLGHTFRIEKYSVKYIMLGIMIIYLIYSRFIEYIKDKLFTNNFSFNIEFEAQNRQYSFKSFLDTGNELREPITNLPCILIEENLINDINFEGKNVYYILYSSIGYGGTLKGIRVNNIKVKKKNCLYEQIDAIICPCKEKLSSEHEFNALLSRGVTYKGDIYGKTNSVF